MRGTESLSLNAAAVAAGIRAPLLYKRFANRAALMEAVREGVLADLTALLRKAQRGRRGPAAVKATAGAYRQWAKREPHLYRLIYAGPSAGVSAAARAATAPVLEEMTALVGVRDALSAARLFTAFLHGFVTMENGGEFKVGGSVDGAFAFGVEAIICGVA